MKQIRVFKVNGCLYGLKVIGGANSHYRYKTPDGKKHRSIKQGIAHLNGKSIIRLGKAWGCKVA